MALVASHVFISLLIFCDQIKDIFGANAPEVMPPDICICRVLVCRCCVTINLTNVCLEVTFAPKDLTVGVNVLVNNKSVFQRSIGPGNFPICAPVLPAACWAFNRIHIDKDNVQVCSEVRIGQVPIYKVPCLGYIEGNIVISPNK